jgi:hypothetical protein
VLENSYIDLKKRDGTYRRVANRVHTSEVNGVLHYTLDFHWPKTAFPGDYSVEVYAIGQGTVLGQGTTQLRLVQVGFPAAIANLAYRHAWIYGLIAVFCAVCMDFVVSRLRPYKPAPPRGVEPRPEVAAPAPVGVAQEHEEEHVHPA